MDTTLVIVALIPSAAAIAGIFLTYYLRERSRLRKQDQTEIFEPVRREVTSLCNQIRDNGYRVRRGNEIWTKSKEFTDTLERGALKRPRLRHLRKDIDRLNELNEDHVKARTSFLEAREQAFRQVHDRVYDGDTEEGGPIALVLVTYATMDDLSQRALAKGDKDSWLHRFKEGLRQLAVSRGRSLDVMTPLEPIFDDLDAYVTRERDVFKRSLDALLGQAELIFTRLEAAVSGNLTYRAS